MQSMASQKFVVRHLKPNHACRAKALKSLQRLGTRSHQDKSMHLKGNFFCIIPHRFLQRDNIKYQATSSCIPAHNRQDTYLDRLTSTSVPVLLGPVSGASFIFSIPISTTGFLGSEITLKIAFLRAFQQQKKSFSASI